MAIGAATMAYTMRRSRKRYWLGAGLAAGLGRDGGVVVDAKRRGIGKAVDVDVERTGGDIVGVRLRLYRQEGDWVP